MDKKEYIVTYTFVQGTFLSTFHVKNSKIDWETIYCHSKDVILQFENEDKDIIIQMRAAQLTSITYTDWRRNAAIRGNSEPYTLKLLNLHEAKTPESER